MKNLAGVKDADKYILEELYLAGIEAVKIETTSGEVPYAFIGKIGRWKLERRWYYWSVFVDKSEKGLPLDKAEILYIKKHPTDETVTLGQIIRAGGDCTCPSPKESYVAQPKYNAEFIAECKSIGTPTRSLKSMGIGEDETEYPDLNVGEIAKLCLEGKIKAERYVDIYHIDEQIGLNEFASFLNIVGEDY